MTLQEAKDQIAQRHYHRRWNNLCPNGNLDGVPDKWVDEAMELYAQDKFDEAALAHSLLNDKRIADIEQYQLKPLQEKYDALCAYVKERKPEFKP